MFVAFAAASQERDDSDPQAGELLSVPVDLSGEERIGVGPCALEMKLVSATEKGLENAHTAGAGSSCPAKVSSTFFALLEGHK